MFPETPPYRGTFPEPVPHATLAKVAEGAEQEQIGAKLRSAVAPLIPIGCEVTYSSLLEEHEPDRWRERHRFPFAAS